MYKLACYDPDGNVLDIDMSFAEMDVALDVALQLRDNSLFGIDCVQVFDPSSGDVLCSTADVDALNG